MKEKELSLRECREKAGKTIEQVAAETGLSYSAVRALEIGLGKNYSPALKHRVSDYFQVNFFKLFPEEKERLAGIMAERKTKHYLLSTLYVFLPNRRFKNESKVAAILKKMTNDELSDLFQSGLTEEERLEHLRRVAKKKNLTMPETN